MTNWVKMQRSEYCSHQFCSLLHNTSHIIIIYSVKDIKLSRCNFFVLIFVIIILRILVILPISMRIGECHSGMFMVFNFEDP